MRDTGTRFNLTPCQFEKWVRFDLWELRQAAFILSGFEPPGLDDLRLTPVVDSFPPTGRRKTWREVLDGMFDQKIEPLFKVCEQWEALESLRTLIRALKVAIKSGALLAEQHFDGGWYPTYVKPDAALRWAKAKGYSIPLELESVAGEIAPISRNSGISLDDVIPPRTKGTLYALLAAVFVAYNGSIPSLEELQRDFEGKDCKEFDPEFLKDTLKKVAEKINKIK